MNSFDSIKLKLDKKSIVVTCKNSNNLSNLFDVKSKVNYYSAKQDQLREYPGLNYISFNDASESLILGISAKILRSFYPSLISLDIIDEVVKNINQAEIIEVNRNALLNSEVLQIHSTKDLIIEGKTIDEVNDALALALYHRKWNTSSYEHQGIMLTKVARTNNLSFCFYNKDLEFLSKKDQELHQYLPSDAFRNVLRSEVKLTSFANQRAYLTNPKSKDALTLKDALNSKENPNYKTFSQVKRDIKEVKPRKQRKTKQDYFIQGVISDYGYDEKAIQAYLKMEYGGKNYHKVLDQYFLPRIQKNNLKEIPEMDYIAESIKEALASGKNRVKVKLC